MMYQIDNFSEKEIHGKTTVPESLFFNKVAGLRPGTLLKKRLPVAASVTIRVFSIKKNTFTKLKMF